MQSIVSRTNVHHAATGLPRASELRSRFLAQDADLVACLGEAYGDDPAALNGRMTAVVDALDHFLASYGDLPCAVFRAPARLSLNPHCDHQGAWVPYGLHIRELLAVIAPTLDDRFEITNTSPVFEPRLAFDADEEIARDRDAWNEGWFRYIEAPAVVDEVRRNVDPRTRANGRRGTLNYVKAAALRLRHALPGLSGTGLRITLSGNITQGGGQSSSSTLVVTTMLALLEFGGLDPAVVPDRREIAERCGEAEWYVGTRGGSGDHAAMLLGSRKGLTHLCFRAPFGIRGARHSVFPRDYQLIVANSQTRSEKSAEERMLYNTGIFAYKFAFLALKQEMQALGLPKEVIETTESLGDLHTGRLSAPDLYRLVLRIPEHIAPAELAARFPDAFAPAARGCFGTDDLERLPAQIPLRGAAIYGLGRVDRGLVMHELLEGAGEAEMREFGRLMTITHDGDRLFRNGGSFTEGRDRLSDTHLAEVLRQVEQGEPRPLRHEPGFYGASISELDHMVDSALATDGVLGAGLMGAGGGGYILILARRGAQEAIRQSLIRDYYQPLGKEPDLETWHPTSAASRIL